MGTTAFQHLSWHINRSGSEFITLQTETNISMDLGYIVSGRKEINIFNFIHKRNEKKLARSSNVP